MNSFPIRIICNNFHWTDFYCEIQPLHIRVTGLRSSRRCYLLARVGERQSRQNAEVCDECRFIFLSAGLPVFVVFPGCRRSSQRQRWVHIRGEFVVRAGCLCAAAGSLIVCLSRWILDPEASVPDQYLLRGCRSCFNRLVLLVIKTLQTHRFYQLNVDGFSIQTPWRGYVHKFVRPIIKKINK